LLDRAARGDQEVLPEVRKLLEDPTTTRWLGGMARVAGKAIVRLAAGDHLAVAEAVEKKLDDYGAKLLADGPGPATFAERLVATRAAHNWLTVHVLETLMAGYEPAGQRATALDKALSRAEARLQTSLKSLAVLRRLRRPAVVAQVNVANGPMLVDNRGGAAGAGTESGAGQSRNS